MSAKFTEVEFREESGFEVEPKYGRRADLLSRFAVLKNGLLADELGETQTVGLHRRLEQAANEAAGLAWTTDFPLLVFPALFAEFARRERLQTGRQQIIRAQTEHLLECSVC